MIRFNLKGKQKLWVGLLIAGAAGAVISNTTPFELDGNAKRDSLQDDWQNVNANGGTSVAHTGVAADPSNFSGGSTVTDQTTFVQGSKDTDDTTSWHWAPGGV